jgi:chromate transporter
LFTGVIHGLKLLAVVVVADATLSMYKSFCKDTLSISIAVITAAILLWISGIWIQIGILVVAANQKVAGAAWGINAAVVGLLLSALYQPVFISAVFSPVEMALVILGFFALRTLNVPIVLLVSGFGVVGMFLH